LQCGNVERLDWREPNQPLSLQGARQLHTSLRESERAAATGGSLQQVGCMLPVGRSQATFWQRKYQTMRVS
jgi:hypothetical protein